MNEIAHENAFYLVYRESLRVLCLHPLFLPLRRTDLIDCTLLYGASFEYVVETRSRFIFLLLQMEDEGNHGNDDTRCFILSTLAALQWSRVSCVLCRAPMLVFDRYPLVDGTFFLSPRQHSSACAEVIRSFNHRSCSSRTILNLHSRRIHCVYDLPILMFLILLLSR